MKTKIIQLPEIRDNPNMIRFNNH